MNAFCRRALWVMVAASAVLGVVMVVVLLRGDPTYLFQMRNRGGVPYGPPGPISFPTRAVTTAALTLGLIAAGRRAFTDAGTDLALPAVIGYACFILDTIVCASFGKAFPEFLGNSWLVLFLLGILYAELIAELFAARGPAPPWGIWGLCLLALAAKCAYSIFWRFAGGA